MDRTQADTWLATAVEEARLDDQGCAAMMRDFVETRPEQSGVIVPADDPIGRTPHWLVDQGIRPLVASWA
ncbi:hypothetical protein [Streptomyces sp. NPDC002853]